MCSFTLGEDETRETVYYINYNDWCMIGVGLVDETQSVKGFAEVIYARFRWLGGKETGTPETVHQRKHRQLRYTIQTDGGQTILVHSPALIY